MNTTQNYDVNLSRRVFVVASSMFAATIVLNGCASDEPVKEQFSALRGVDSIDATDSPVPTVDDSLSEKKDEELEEAYVAPDNLKWFPLSQPLKSGEVISFEMTMKTSDALKYNAYAWTDKPDYIYRYKDKGLGLDHVMLDSETNRKYLLHKHHLVYMLDTETSMVADDIEASATESYTIDGGHEVAIISGIMHLSNYLDSNETVDKHVVIMCRLLDKNDHKQIGRLDDALMASMTLFSNDKSDVQNMIELAKELASTSKCVIFANQGDFNLAETTAYSERFKSGQTD